MRAILLIATATAMKHCNTTDFSAEIEGLSGGQNGQENRHNEHKSDNRLRVSFTQNAFSGATETPMSEPIPSEEQQNEVKRFKEIAAKAKEHDPNIDKPILNVNFERGVGQISIPNDVVPIERQAEQLFNSVESGARNKRHVLKSSRDLNMTWYGGVSYTFNTTDEIVLKAFKLGVNVWRDNTCIDFVQDRNARDKLVVIKGNECWSDVGRAGGDQLLSLDSRTTEGSAVHEIGHALGLFHTMTRYDRDDFIRVVMENVDPHYINEFAKVNHSYADVYGLTYDYGSIMHYDELKFSGNKKPTMIAVDPLYQNTMGSDFISFSDIFMINEHYGCNKICNKSTSAKCSNEGYPHPRNCSTCICPGGYGGALCDQRPPGCGKDLTASGIKQLVINRVGRGISLKDQFSFCNYMITAPEGKKIEVDVQSISRGYDDSGCPRGGVEVKAQKDQKLTGYRFCSLKGSGGPIISNYNRLPVILFSRFGSMKVSFTYRYID